MNIGVVTEKQFQEIVETYEKLVFTICYQFVKDYYEAQNLTQETFLSAYQHLDNYQGTNYKPWLARIAANKAKDYLGSAYARRVQLTEPEDTQPLLPVACAPEDIYIEKESEQTVASIIYALKEPYRQISILHFIQEKTTDEIAAALDRPKRTVETQIYRAKQILRKQIRKEEHYG